MLGAMRDYANCVHARCVCWLALIRPVLPDRADDVPTHSHATALSRRSASPGHGDVVVRRGRRCRPRLQRLGFRRGRRRAHGRFRGLPAGVDEGVRDIMAIAFGEDTGEAQRVTKLGR